MHFSCYDIKFSAVKNGLKVAQPWLDNDVLGAEVFVKGQYPICLVI